VGGGADAVVFDAPSCKSTSSSPSEHQRDPVDGTITRENYGIALPIGSALRKKTNETLLDITADGTYDELYSKYFEDVHSG